MTVTISDLVAIIARASDPHGTLDAILNALDPLDLCRLRYDWEAWARPQQLEPEHHWRSWGAITGRGWGKTRTFAEYVAKEACSGRATRIALIAQNEDKTRDVLVHGESGLIACSPPWCKPTLELGRLVWPNGSQAFIYSPEVPGTLFGPEHHLGWASELHAWPRTTMKAAFGNLRLGLRLGEGKLVWDTNPKRRHPIITMLIERGMRDPLRHVVVRGTTYENRANLTKGALEEWEAEFGGTQVGQEMLHGIQFDEEDGAVFHQEWIEQARRKVPDKVRLRILGVDPATSLREGTDATGIVMCGLGTDGQLLVLQDLSARISWEAWGSLVIDTYEQHRCDCIVIERNRGGDACVGNLRAVCRERGLAVQILDLQAPLHGRIPGIVYVKEVVSRASKESRAEAIAPLYERGRISHCGGGSLDQLEEQMTTWVPDGRCESPNSLDAMVFCMWELAGLWRDKPTSRPGAMCDTAEAARRLTRAAAQVPSLQRALHGASRRL